MPRRLGLRLQAAEQLAAADMREAPMEVARKGGESGDEIGIALLGDGASDRDDAQRIGRIGTVARRPVLRSGRKAREVEAVVEKRHVIP